MNNPNTIENIVREILEVNKEARSDDMKLYLLVCEVVNPLPCHRKIGTLTFASVMNHYKKLNLPHFESVRRARAKLQSNHPGLVGDNACRKSRRRRGSIYRNYAKNRRNTVGKDNYNAAKN